MSRVKIAEFAHEIPTCRTDLRDAGTDAGEPVSVRAGLLVRGGRPTPAPPSERAGGWC